MISSQPILFQRVKILTLTLVFVLISACSFKSIYNQLDFFIQDYIEGMVSLDDVLDKKVEQRTQLLIGWHRNTQLKEYADWFRVLQQDVNADISEQTLIKHINKIDYFWTSLSRKLNDEMADLLPLLNSEQRTELFANITKKNQEFSEDYIEIDDEERIDSYTETMHENYENWLGSLTDYQVSMIKQAAIKINSVAPFRLKKRLLWQNGIQNILTSNETATLNSDGLRTFFAEYETNDNPEIKTRNELNRRIFTQLTIKIIQTMTAEQKEYFMNKTSEYIRMFTELAENR